MLAAFGRDEAGTCGDSGPSWQLYAGRAFSGKSELSYRFVRIAASPVAHFATHGFFADERQATAENMVPCGRDCDHSPALADCSD